jgi:hypothetical protein
MQTHPSQISPSENFDIFYFLRNPTDTTTYYVQAVIYDIRTGAILKTVQLAQSLNNPHLFTAVAAAPADPQGVGRNIVAVATVYTDGAYTTKSTDYEEQEQYFLVKTPSPIVVGGGGFDMRQLKETLDTSIRAIVKSELAAAENDEQEPMPFDAIFGAIGALQREINRIPKDAPDHSAIVDALDELKSQVSELPEPNDETDLSPVLGSLSNIETALADVAQDGPATRKAIDQLRSDLKSISAEIKTNADSTLKDMFDRQHVAIPLREIFSGASSKKEPDLSHLHA